MSVAEIKAAIQKLTLEERSKVAACLHNFKDDAWDRTMKRDLAAGKLDTLLAEVNKDIADGKLLPFP